MGSSEPLISIVVPSFNYERYILECLESVLDQDYENIELVVVDDCSSDNSVSEVERLLSSNEATERLSGRRTVEVNSRNLGAHETINRGIEIATGEIVCILNADDLFGPGRISKMFSELKTRGARFAFSKVEYIDATGRPFDEHEPLVQRLALKQRSIPKYPSVGFACLASNVAVSTGNFMFEKKLFLEAGPFSNLRFCHDWDFLLRCILTTEPIFVENASYMYRIHGNNTFRSLSNVADSESAQVYRAYFDRIVAAGYTNAKAPSPDAWPGVFEAFMSAYGLWPFWTGGIPDTA
jgi:glycosyltransferase involved in cell wall biosynthesis